MKASAWGAREDENADQGELRKISPPLSLRIIFVGKEPVTNNIMSVLDPLLELEAGLSNEI